MFARRRSVCAASALVGVMAFASSAWGVYVKDIVDPADFAPGVHERVVYSPEVGGLILNKSLNCTPFIWVPSTSGNTVSKIDARTGSEIARYRLGPENESWTPRAVAADPDGNVYIACLCYEGTGKVVRIEALGGADRNGDGVVNTCCDGDMNGRITPSEVLPWGTDERVGTPIDVGPEGGAPSCLAFDASGYLWVGLWGARSVAKVDLIRRAVVATVSLVGRPSSMVADQRGSLWVLSRDNKVLCQVSTATATLREFYSLNDGLPSDLCIDQNGKLWITDQLQGMVGYQTATGVWSTHQTVDAMGLAGVTVDADGDIWAACPRKNQIAHFSGEDGGFIDYLPTGVEPGSVCTDEDGYVWTLDSGGRTATRIDARDSKRVLTTQTPDSPFSSTPFASCVIRHGVCPDGEWRGILDSRIKGAGWGTVSWNCSLNGGSVRVEIRSAEVVEALRSAAFQVVKSGKQFSAPAGRYLEVRVVLESRNGVSPVVSALHVEGANRAPDISAAVPTLERITRLDHNMEPVSIAGICDPDGDSFTVTVTRVTQDEPVAGLFEDDNGPDATGIGTSTAMLRAEIAPGTFDAPANGRVYAISFKAVDALGAASTGRVKVIVPTGILPTDRAKDDGQKYDATKGLQVAAKVAAKPA